ncbi:hypothetical protein Phum_PHUM441200 [Pediculus humanus corporis]|uniref:Uncharacterized protein n=1 Tax=Pediculus humanus subsp. corporis TaxID=121224 RepID=E0VU01_PEDHC|nr:uncharacterized protein Phum_PHUM441200 [Pediculus humanus corporis]EEB16857.1 hypothetical protein Phum_PHUM441200 [Pediculus humanus corporis]
MLIDSRLLLKQQQHENVEIDVLQTNKKKKTRREEEGLKNQTNNQVSSSLSSDSRIF